MVKVITFFLIGILILAIFGKLRLPGNLSGRGQTPKGGVAGRLNTARKCPKCGRYSIGNAPCDCKTTPTKRT